MGPQWGWHDDHESDQPMPLSDRIRQLRKEHGWSQAELGAKIGTDPGRISRYEAGRITPSADALVRLAQTFNISLDHLLIDDIPRRALHAPEHILGDRAAAITELDDHDRAALLDVIDAYVTRNRLRTITTDSA